MKKQLIVQLMITIPVFMLMTCSLKSQGVYNNGGKIVIGSGVYFNINGTAGNFRNETNVSDGSVALNGTLILGGNYTNNVAGSDILSTVGVASLVSLTGTAIQTLGGTSTAPFTFNNLTINNSSGVIISKNDIVKGLLTLTNGLVDIGNNDLIFGPASTIAGTPSAVNMIIATGTGQVKKQFGAIGSFTFPVGDNNVTAKYSPVTLNFTTGTFATGAFAGINLVNASYPDPYITTSYLNRYWNVTQTGISGYTCDAMFQYVPADVVGTESDIYAVRINPIPITPFNPTNAALHQLTATGLTSLGTFTGALGIKYLNLTLFLEGLYIGAGTMSQAQGAAGNEFPGTTAEQVTVELHDPATYANMVYSIGNVDVSTIGAAKVQIPSIFSGSYYVTVRERNHIATVTSAPVSLTNPLVSYNFSISANQAFGSNMKTLEPGVYGLYAGDANGDGAVDALDLLAVQNDATLFSSGYIPTDLNGDGVIDALDLMLAQNNSLLFISSITP